MLFVAVDTGARHLRDHALVRPSDLYWLFATFDTEVNILPIAIARFVKTGALMT